METTVFECPACHKIHFDASVVADDGCEADRVVRRKARIILVDDASEDDEDDASAPSNTRVLVPVRRGVNSQPNSSGRKSRPGPKPFDIEGRLRTRLPAYDDGDDERIDHMFETSGLLDEFLDTVTTTHMIAPFLFRVLWSKHAPERLRSFALHRNCVYEVSRDGCVLNRGAVRKRFVRELTLYILELTHTMLSVSMPTRRPQDMDRARTVLSLIDTTFIQGLTVRDALSRSPAFIKYRTAGLMQFVEQVESSMYAEFSRSVWTPHDT